MNKPTKLAQPEGFRYMNPPLSVVVVFRFPSRAALVLALAAGLIAPSQRGRSQEVVAGQNISTNRADKTACERQLNLIFGALREYRKQHSGQWPARLSDLAPDLLPPEVLICPFVQKRGGLRTWKKRHRELAPDTDTSYGYEFTPALLDYDQWRGRPRKTWREFKEHVARELGPVVPVVRCHDHRPTLNLAVGGTIYESGLYWEKNFTENDHMLAVTKLFPSTTPSLNAADFPPRDPRANARLLDLTGYYNASLTNSWQGFPGNDLARLPSGLQVFDGTRFDVRGVIQLCGEDLPATYPKRVEGIRVQQRCRRLHLLHALGFTSRSGSVGGHVEIRYADGHTEELPLVNGRHTADWWFDSERPGNPTEAGVAWTGDNEAARAYGKRLRLVHSVWENPLKDAEIATLSLDVGAREDAPFFIAVTLE